MTPTLSNSHDALLAVALDLAGNLAASDRYRRIAAAVRRVIPCDSAALLRLEGGVLVPVGVDGLVPETVGKRFPVAEHPRLAQVLAASSVVRLSGSPLPDPFDGLLLAAGANPLHRVHACMGTALVIEGEVVGVLVVDALNPSAFDGVEDAAVSTFAALAAASMRTSALIEGIEEAARRQGLVARELLKDARARGGSEILGISAEMSRVRDEVAMLAETDLSVLLLGETGTGKEVVARAIHAASRRRNAPFIQVNCAALPESVAESELFGHVRGAFTGATDARAGKFEIADGGTLLLDEVGELPASVQAKLLRALQSGDLQRVGADRPIRVDVRILAATNRDLAAEVRAGLFRADLYHRLSVYPLHLPALRDHRADIPLLAGWFLDQARRRLGLGMIRLDPAARAALVAADWPGNVRELEHLMLRAALKASGGRRRAEVLVEAVHLGLPSERAGIPVETTSEPPLRELLDATARAAVRHALDASDGNLAAASRRLGVDRANLLRLARRLGVR